jgi:serine/threonine protein kinase
LHTSQEVGILKGLNYDRNIVQFYGACVQDGSDPILVTEYMEGAGAVEVRVLHQMTTMPTIGQATALHPSLCEVPHDMS